MSDELLSEGHKFKGSKRRAKKLLAVKKTKEEKQQQKLQMVVNFASKRRLKLVTKAECRSNPEFIRKAKSKKPDKNGLPKGKLQKFKFLEFKRELRKEAMEAVQKECADAKEALNVALNEAKERLQNALGEFEEQNEMILNIEQLKSGYLIEEILSDLEGYDGSARSYEDLYRECIKGLRSFRYQTEHRLLSRAEQDKIYEDQNILRCVIFLQKHFFYQDLQRRMVNEAVKGVNVEFLKRILPYVEFKAEALEKFIKSAPEELWDLYSSKDRLVKGHAFNLMQEREKRISIRPKPLSKQEEKDRIKRMLEAYCVQEDVEFGLVA